MVDAGQDSKERTLLFVFVVTDRGSLLGDALWAVGGLGT